MSHFEKSMALQGIPINFLAINRETFIEWHRKRGLRRQNMIKKDGKDLVKLIAEMIWKERPETRIGEMCHLVWDVYLDQIDTANIDQDSKNIFKLALPDTAKGLRNWLKEYAPPAAEGLSQLHTITVPAHIQKRQLKLFSA